MKFTEKSVKDAAAKSTNDQFIWDDELPGFGIRAREGRARYVIQFRVGKAQRRMTFDNVMKVTLDDARKWARRSFGKVADDIDPTVERAKAQSSGTTLFKDAIEDFITFKLNHGTSASWLGQMTLALRERFKPLHGIPLKDIDRAMVAKANRGNTSHGKVSSDRSRSALSSFFTWAIGEGLCEANPVNYTNTASGTYQVRERTLTTDEIRKLWHALDDYTNFGKCVKLLLLTGQRRTEIGDLSWTEVDFDKAVATLPGDRVKNGNTHLVPLSKPAIEILRSCRQRKNSDFMLGNSKGFTDWFKSKRDLDEVLKIQHWTLHDLRRTAATVMGDIGILPHVIEAILNHTSSENSARRGIAGKYQMSLFLDQRREALDKYAAHIMKVVAEPQKKLKLVA